MCALHIKCLTECLNLKSDYMSKEMEPLDKTTLLLNVMPLICCVVLFNLQCRLNYHLGKVHGFMAGGCPSAILLESLDHSLLLFPVKRLHSIDLLHALQFSHTR